MTKKIFELLLLFAIVSCEPPVTFDQPQPSETRAMKKFPRQLFGHYLSPDGKSTIVIGEKNIYKIHDYYVYTHKDSLYKDHRIKGDTVFFDMTGNYQIVKIKNDTVIEHVNYTDTLFKFDNSTVLKKFKGNYFLNYAWDAPNAWTVQKLTLVKGILSIADIKTKEGIYILSAITETPKDTISYNFKTSKKQFKEFLKLDGFQDVNYYIKIK
jgi:hypothetical protein